MLQHTSAVDLLKGWDPGLPFIDNNNDNNNNTIVVFNPPNATQITIPSRNMLYYYPTSIGTNLIHNSIHNSLITRNPNSWISN